MNRKQTTSHLCRRVALITCLLTTSVDVHEGQLICAGTNGEDDVLEAVRGVTSEDALEQTNPSDVADVSNASSSASSKSPPVCANSRRHCCTEKCGKRSSKHNKFSHQLTLLAQYEATFAFNKQLFRGFIWTT